MVHKRLHEFEALLGYSFGNDTLLREALTHPSVASTHEEWVGYERLEFFGDRVLGLVAAEMLLEKFTDDSEGELARRHSALVRRETLADVARAIQLGGFLRMSQGEEDTGGRENPAILADACEAVIAALYMDGGLEPARRFIRTAWAPFVDRNAPAPRDPKTALQEWAQKETRELPVYEVISQIGPDHAPIFEVQVSVKGHPPARASATSKRGAEKAGAEILLDHIERAQAPANG